MENIYPQKLKKGDKVAVIAPARSMHLINAETRSIAKENFDRLGLELVFGKHVEEFDNFNSATVDKRIEDLHWAFEDSQIKGVFTVIGGFNSNQLLEYIDWEKISTNPKVFCGFSDITVLHNSIYAKTGLVTYYGPHYSTFGQKLGLDYTIEYAEKAVMQTDQIEVTPSDNWSDDSWWMDQKDRDFIKNDGYWVINPGEAQGKALGGNLGTFNLLMGTEFMPDVRDSILFIEDDSESQAWHFDRQLQAVLHQRGFETVKAVVIGRFQKESKITKEELESIIKSKKELLNIPVVANVDFGHTEPRITIPIGGEAKIKATKKTADILFLRH